MKRLKKVFKLLSSRFYNRNFFLYWTSNVLSDIGDTLHSVALGFWIMTTTQNILDLSILMVAKAVPSIVLSPIAGTLADRMDKRKIMRSMDILQGIVVGLIAYLLTKGETDTILYLIFFLTFLSGIFRSIHDPARQSTLVRLVTKDEIHSATALHRLSSTIVMVSGPMLGGVLVAAFGSEKALLIDSISFMIAAALISSISMHFNKKEVDSTNKKSDFWKELKEGLNFVYTTRPLNLLVILNNTLNIFGVAQGILMAAMAVNVWKLGSVGYGLIEASFPIGMVFGAAIIMKLPNLRRRGKWVCLTYALAGLFGILVPFTDNLTLAIILLAIDGCFTVMGSLLVNILFRVYIDPDMQGRAFGIYGSIASVASPLGALTGGILADSLGVFSSVVGISVAFSIIPILMFLFSPRIREID